jgi:hypothetical protein
MVRQKNKEPHGLPKKENVAPIIPKNPMYSSQWKPVINLTTAVVIASGSSSGQTLRISQCLSSTNSISKPLSDETYNAF